MDLTTLLTIMGCFAAQIALILVMFFWNRTESRADYRRCEDLISAIKEEIKDFHGRLCAIEERRK